jgi:hypothetical protein
VAAVEVLLIMVVLLVQEDQVVEELDHKEQQLQERPTQEVVAVVLKEIILHLEVQEVQEL